MTSATEALGRGNLEVRRRPTDLEKTRCCASQLASTPDDDDIFDLSRSKRFKLAPYFDDFSKMNSISNSDSSGGSNTSRTMFDEIKHEVKEWASASTAHGIPNIARTNRTYIRIIWTVSTLVSAGVCSYLVVSSVLSYANFDVVTVIKKVGETPAIFPTITICNGNQFTTLKAMQFVEQTLTLLNVTQVNPFIYPSSYEQSLNPIYDYIFDLSMTAQSKAITQLTEAEQEELNVPLASFISFCLYSSIQCNLSDFVWAYRLSCGSCYTYNSGFDSAKNPIPFQYSTNTDLGGGFDVELFVATSDSPYNLAFWRGPFVIIQNSSVDPLLGKAVMLQPGVQTVVRVSREFNQMLPWPYNDCTQDFSASPYYAYVQTKPYTYRQQDCMWYMAQQKLVDECSCYDSSMPKVLGTTVGICEDSTQNECMYDVYSSFFEAENVEKYTTVCPLECESSTLKFSLSFSSYPTVNYAKQLAAQNYTQDRFRYVTNETVTVEMVQKSFARLIITYDELNYKLTQESPKQSIIDLISANGGTLGLFLGVSLLSFMENVEIVLIIVEICFKRRRSVWPRRIDVQPI